MRALRGTGIGSRTFGGVGVVAMLFVLAAPADGKSASGAIIGGYYSSADYDQILRDKNVQIFRGLGFTSMERRIQSNFEDDVWRVSQEWYEDGTSTAVDGSAGVLFSVEDSGPYWGFHNRPDSVVIFIVDNDNLVAAQADNISAYNQIKFNYWAFRTDKNAMKAYDCHFDTKRFRNAKAITLARSKFSENVGKNTGDILLEISKFLAENGVDLIADHCAENPEYLEAGAKRYNENMKELSAAK